MADFPDFKLFLFSKHSALYFTHFKIILYTTIKLFLFLLSSPLFFAPSLFHIQLNICSSQVSPGDTAFPTIQFPVHKNVSQMFDFAFS